MLKRCGCDYQGGCICDSTPEKTISEKVEDLLNKLRSEMSLHIFKIENERSGEIERLKEEVSRLNRIIKKSKIIDPAPLRREIIFLGKEIKEYKKQESIHLKIIKSLLLFHPRLDKAYKEVEDREFLGVINSYKKQVRK